jgi:hypothetical protein
MSSSVSITTALCLAASDVETLIQGRMIAAISRTFINAVPRFALCPTPHSDDDQTVRIQAWARLESCKIYSDPVEIEKLAQLTIWSNQNLQNLLQERHKLFLAYLRVYQLPQIVEISAERITSDKVGSFIRLPSLAATTANPVLNDALFKQRYQQLINLEVPPHPELEKLHNELTNLNSSKAETKFLLDDLKIFLGWLSEQSKTDLDPDSTWIKTIASTGNSSDGDTFEKLVRKSLIKLGFSNSNTNPQASLDPNGCGGAGGLDFYCQEPYQVVGECKATRTETVSDGTPAQLIKLGHKHLQQKYNGCIKIIMAAGQLNSHARQTAIGNRMNVIRPETLQRLVELKAKHPGAVDLFELKPYLEEEPFGEEVDTKVNGYIDEVWQQVKERSNIIQTVKKMKETEPDQPHFEVSDIKAEYNANFAKQSNRLDIQKTREILLELSSPLTGYLGRRKATDGSDRFYFLRELHVD